jgi:hypothetical protein
LQELRNNIAGCSNLLTEFCMLVPSLLSDIGSTVAPSAACAVMAWQSEPSGSMSAALYESMIV